MIGAFFAALPLLCIYAELVFTIKFSFGITFILNIFNFLFDLSLIANFIIFSLFFF